MIPKTQADYNAYLRLCIPTDISTSHLKKECFTVLLSQDKARLKLRYTDKDKITSEILPNPFHNITSKQIQQSMLDFKNMALLFVKEVSNKVEGKIILRAIEPIKKKKGESGRDWGSAKAPEN